MTRAAQAAAGQAGDAHLQSDDEHQEEVEVPKRDQHARGSNPGRAVSFKPARRGQEDDGERRRAGAERDEHDEYDQ